MRGLAVLLLLLMAQTAARDIDNSPLIWYNIYNILHVTSLNNRKIFHTDIQAGMIRLNTIKEENNDTF